MSASYYYGHIGYKHLLNLPMLYFSILASINNFFEPIIGDRSGVTKRFRFFTFGDMYYLNREHYKPKSASDFIRLILMVSGLVYWTLQPGEGQLISQYRRFSRISRGKYYSFGATNLFVTLPAICFSFWKYPGSFTSWKKGVFLDGIIIAFEFFKSIQSTIISVLYFLILIYSVIIALNSFGTEDRLSVQLRRYGFDLRSLKDFIDIRRLLIDTPTFSSLDAILAAKFKSYRYKSAMIVFPDNMKDQKIVHNDLSDRVGFSQPITQIIIATRDSNHKWTLESVVPNRLRVSLPNIQGFFAVIGLGLFYYLPVLMATFILFGTIGYIYLYSIIAYSLYILFGFHHVSYYVGDNIVISPNSTFVPAYFTMFEDLGVNNVDLFNILSSEGADHWFSDLIHSVRLSTVRDLVKNNKVKFTKNFRLLYFHDGVYHKHIATEFNSQLETVVYSFDDCGFLRKVVDEHASVVPGGEFQVHIFEVCLNGSLLVSSTTSPLP